ncbi:response regulator transcription factor [Pseudonocardia xishanensis]|uniref:Response regulator transcription factor n=1 Tax=Pseudonocardia xishanensis TaxID=630995 RepID=A0ABP8RJE9_9PSEU
MLVVDDEPMVCAHLTTILGAAGLEVVGAAADGAEAVELVVRYGPDVVLMDLRMPGVDGVAATARITAMPEPPAVVVLTTFAGDAHVRRALQAGAAGYLLKSTPPTELADLVRVAARGHAVFSRPTVTGLAGDADATRRLAVLSDREREVAALLAEGCSNAEVGARLHLTEATVKGYVSSALTKLDLQNRTQLALLASRGS